MTGNSINLQNNAKKGGILKFFKGMKAEVKIITWPSIKETKKTLIAVAVVTLIYVILVGTLDYTFKNLFEAILKLK